mgnify:CR=1 FL=1
MRNLIALFLTMLFIVIMTAASAQNNSLNTAIKECKSTEKTIVENLSSNTPNQLLLTEYEKVIKKVESYLDETLKEFEEHAENNSLKMKNKEFEINVGKKNKSIKSLISEYLNSYRDDWLEKEKEENKNIYADTITKMILSQHYVPTLLEGLETYSVEWLQAEEERYVNFLKTKTVHIKIKEETMMQEMASEYIKNDFEKRNNLFLYLMQGQKISTQYGGSISIEYKSKFDFTYISKLETILTNFASKGNTGVTKSDLEENKIKIVKDIKEHIENSTQIK